MSEVRTLKPGILVSIKTHNTGNRRYEKREIERPHVTDGGVERSRWDTTKIVFDPAEAKEAGQVANRARYLVTRLCADTAHGPLCPMNRRDELNEAIAEARQLVDDFNDSAKFTHVELNVICGEVRADDENTARAMFSETEKLMRQMQEALEAMDTKRITQLCSKALSVGQILSPAANANVVAAVTAAREARKKIVAAGENAVVEIDRKAVDMIGLARNAFLDFNVGEDLEIKPIAEAARSLDFDQPPAEDEEVDVEAALRYLDLEEV